MKEGEDASEELGEQQCGRDRRGLGARNPERAEAPGKRRGGGGAPGVAGLGLAAPVSGLGSIPAGETVGVRQGDDKVSFPC